MTTTPAGQLTDLESRRRRNGQFGPRVAGEAPAAALNTPEPVHVHPVKIVDSDSGPAEHAISQVASRSMTTFHAGFYVEVVDYAWVEATTGGVPFSADEHTTAQHEQQGRPADIDRTGTVDGVDYHVASARVWRFRRDGHVVAEQTKWASSVSEVDSITDGEAEAAELVTTLDLDPDDIEYEVGFLLDADTVDTH